LENIYEEKKSKRQATLELCSAVPDHHLHAFASFSGEQQSVSALTINKNQRVVLATILNTLKIGVILVHSSSPISDNFHIHTVFSVIV